MKRLVIIGGILGVLCHLSVVDCKGLPIKGTNGKRVQWWSKPRSYNEEQRRQLGVGPRPVDTVDNGPKDAGKGTKDSNNNSSNQGPVDDEREGNTGGGGGGDPIIVLDPTPSPTTRPTILPTMTLVTPTAAPSETPSALPSSPTVLAETIAPTGISPTTSPSNLGTNSGTITRNLLPFDITVQGEESEMQMVQIPLELSLNEFLSETMDGSFESFKDITLETTELGTIQRQASRKSFGFTGDAKFYDVNVPTTEEVHDAQQRALSEFSFELQNILNERNVSVNVVDISLDDDEDRNTNQQDNGDEDNDDGDNSEDTSSARGGIEQQIVGEPSDSSPVAIGVGTTVAVLVLVCAILLYLQQRKQKIEDNKELDLLDDPDLMDDPDLDGDAPVDHMIDTSAGPPQSQSMLASAEFV
ncbi:unnamed protein product [Cylindrotheca closterium]|uniref:Uncharacterized protein n=1 Tax=Cylindrotheca closterium TaxID=2856 RepID=A0AAD2FYZ3_9STRA|nr:unnamed protein product [Cylindrotheca closterium]